MVDEPGRFSTWLVRIVVVAGAITGYALVVAAIVADDPPRWWWFAGIGLALGFGALLSIWIRYRMRYTAEERNERYSALATRRDTVAQPLERSRLAHRATRHKAEVLRSGVDGVAVITFVADGKRANEFRQLVYLELDVSVGVGQPVHVRTGEYVTAASAGSVAPGRELFVKVDPADPQRVAVDWERSLRLT